MPVRFHSVRRRVRGVVEALAALALIGACSSPGEAPPLAPRPGPIDPTATPVPGAPAPGTPLDPHTPGPVLPGDAGVPITSARATFQASAETMQRTDAGVARDAGPPTDARVPVDARAPTDAPPADATAATPDALDPGTPGDAATLPPTVPDALLPIDAGRATR